MRSIWFLAVLVLACERGADVKDDDGPMLPTARGSVELTPTSPEVMDTLLATEAEILRSRGTLRRMNESRRFEGELVHEAIRVVRRGRTMTLDVFVGDPDPARARHLCEALLDTYEYDRFARQSYRLRDRQAWFVSELERRPDDAELKRQIATLDDEIRTLVRDARRVGDCQPAGKTRFPAPPPASPLLAASIALDPRPPAAATTAIASAVESLRSDQLVQLTNERVRANDKGPELAHGSIRATRRGDSMIIDISVNHPDPARATLLCNTHVMTYLDSLRAELVRNGQPAIPDVHVLDPCGSLSDATTNPRVRL